jgi:hypothetical protein
MYRQHREYQSYQYQSETKKQQFWALSYRTSIELYGNNNWKIMDFTRRLVGSKPKLFWMFWDRSKWPQSRRPSLYWESSSVRCPKKTKSGMDRWSLVDFLDCVFFSYVFSMMFHDLYFHWILFDMELVIVFVCFDLKVVNDPKSLG